jgi:hypothetical protein
MQIYSERSIHWLVSSYTPYNYNTIYYIQLSYPNILYTFIIYKYKYKYKLW